MSNIKALIAGKLRKFARGLEEMEQYEAERWADGTVLTTLELTQAADSLEAVQRREAFARLREIDEALEAVQQTPAVDRGALAAVIHERFNIARGRGGVAPLALADQILASGILQDAAEVEACGLEKAAQAADTYDLEVVSSDWLRARAQQLREST